MTDKAKEEMPWQRTRGWPLDYHRTGNGRVDDDFTIPGYFIPESEARELWQLRQSIESITLDPECEEMKKRMARLEEAAKAFLELYESGQIMSNGRHETNVRWDAAMTNLREALK